jgi:hypothetical protein
MGEAVVLGELVGAVPVCNNIRVTFGMLVGLKNVSSADDDEGAAELTASAQQGSFATPESARTAHTTTTHTHTHSLIRVFDSWEFL